MKLTKTLFATLILPLAFLGQSSAQESLLEELDEDPIEKEFVPAFKAMKIGNLQSTKVASAGDWYMYVSHRFGNFSDGLSTFFGLDAANTKIQLVYGVLDGLQVGISRESLRKTYAGSVKFRLMKQEGQKPVNLTAYSTFNWNSQLSADRYPNLWWPDRLSYATQLLISRSFGEKFSLELAPTYVRQNLVWQKTQSHDQLAIGLGSRLKLTKRLSLNADYVWNLSRVDYTQFRDPLTIGLDLETGGHVFQLLFSNAQSTNEPGFISNAEGQWLTGDVFFGFNIVRVF